MTKLEMAQQMIAALNTEYAAPECCVLCGGEMFVALALNPAGERKGLCSGHHTGDILPEDYHGLRRMIARGYFD